MTKDKDFIDSANGGQPVKGDDDAAAVLAQGNSRAKKVAQTWGMKDRNADGTKLTGRS